MSKKKKICLLAVCIFIGVLLCLYLGGIFYFQNRFFPKTFINGTNFSNMKTEEVEEVLSEDAVSYTLTIIDENNKEYIMPDEYNLVYVPNGEVQDTKACQNSYLWFLSLFNNKEYNVTLKTTYEQNKLKERLDELQIIQDVKVVEAEDAYIEFADNRYEIIAEVIGRSLDKEELYKDIFASIGTGQSELNLADYQIYDTPEVTSEDESLVAELTNLNKIINLTITYQFSSQERVLEGAAIKDWVDISEDDEITVNRNYVYEYVLSLAKEFNTFGTNREFTTTSGKTIVIEGGDYGWIINKDAETDALVEIIKSGESVTREPLYEAVAATHDGIDTGNPDTYVEIDLTNQHLWYYMDGVMRVESDIVSGTKTKTPTREGTFAVMFKKTDYTLVGETYSRPVDYFIAFYTDVGLHDASWRTAFGGSLYLNGGSHGCINMPHDKVAQIYQLITEGTVVYCYY